MRGTISPLRSPEADFTSGFAAGPHRQSGAPAAALRARPPSPSDLASDLTHHLLDLTPDRESGRALRHQAAQRRQRYIRHVIETPMTSSRLTKRRCFSAIWMRSISVLTLT